MTKTLEKPVEVALVKKGENLYVPLNFKKHHAYFSKPDGTGAYHGVTSILRVIAKPALIQWAANMVCEYIEKTCEYTPETKDGEVDYYHVLPEQLEKARFWHKDQKEDAGAKGSDVHELIEAYVKGLIEKCNGEANGANYLASSNPNGQVQLFIQWARDNSVRFIESEKVVYSKESWYAGTLDLVLEKDGKKYIADVKTSSGIYPEAYLQMAAYQGALEEMNEHTDIAGSVVINLPKKGGFEVGYNYDYEGNRIAFLAALVLYRQLNAIK